MKGSPFGLIEVTTMQDPKRVFLHPDGSTRDEDGVLFDQLYGLRTVDPAMACRVEWMLKHPREAEHLARRVRWYHRLLVHLVESW